MYQEFKDRAAFYVVYIQEAHASDVWQLGINERQNVVYASPKNYDERAGVASACMRNLKIEFPALLDRFDNATEIAYSAWPDRLYVVGRDGRIAYKGKPGPWGFRPREVEKTLLALLAGG